MSIRQGVIGSGETRAGRSFDRQLVCVVQPRTSEGVGCICVCPRERGASIAVGFELSHVSIFVLELEGVQGGDGVERESAC
jgi:hypothetical protein